MTMTNNRPYIVSALYEWIVDNDCTPYILIDSQWPGINLPPQFTDEEEIVLNISPVAIRDLNITHEDISFMARFNNEAYNIVIPINATLAIYAQENGQGMVFDQEPYPNTKNKNIVQPSNNKADENKKLSAGSFVSISNPDKKAGIKSGSTTKEKPNLKVIK